jgi:cytochrome b
MTPQNNLTNSSSDLHAVRVWDLPTRVFHVLLILAIVGLVITGEIGGAIMQWHFYCGYFVLSLLLFRVVWGCVGGHWSRFVHFVPTPSRVKAYLSQLLSGGRTASVGHNPLGALSVLAMLFLLLVQVFSGFMSDDEIAASGPWTALVSSDTVEWVTEYHSDVGKVLLIVLVLLHVASVLFYKRFKQDDLITPMLSGDKSLPADTPASRDTAGSRLLALVLWAACAYVVNVLVHWAS